ncbi:Fc.00g026580.m01.CDS01 [Cosmosporella sp. VM-42]
MSSNAEDAAPPAPSSNHSRRPLPCGKEFGFGYLSSDDGEQAKMHTYESWSQGQVCSNCGTMRTPAWRKSPQGTTICNACGLYLKSRNISRPTAFKKLVEIPIDMPGATPRQATSAPFRIKSARKNTPRISFDDISIGTCPGRGYCNGTGGAENCRGCPAYNNLVSNCVPLKGALNRVHGGTPSEVKGNGDIAPHPSTMEAETQSSYGYVACHNCEATATPIWRRDKNGNKICNACGLYLKFHGKHRPVAMKKLTIKRRKRTFAALQAVETGDGVRDIAGTTDLENTPDDGPVHKVSCLIETSSKRPPGNCQSIESKFFLHPNERIPRLLLPKLPVFDSYTENNVYRDLMPSAGSAQRITRSETISKEETLPKGLSSSTSSSMSPMQTGSLAEVTLDIYSVKQNNTNSSPISFLLNPIQVVNGTQLNDPGGGQCEIGLP